LQGFPRDDEVQGFWSSSSAVDVKTSVEDLIWCLQCLSDLIKRKKGFSAIKSSSSSSSSSSSNNNITTSLHEGAVEFHISVVKGCTESFNSEVLQCQLEDWFIMVERQHVLQREHQDLPDQIRQAEMTMSISGAPEQSLRMVKQRLEEMNVDRQLRLDVLKELIEDICLREMNLFVTIIGPDPKQSLSLKPTTAVGFLGIPLQQAGERLPVG